MNIADWFLVPKSPGCVYSQPQTDRYLHNASSLSRASFQQLYHKELFFSLFLLISFLNEGPLDPDKTMDNILSIQFNFFFSCTEIRFNSWCEKIAFMGNIYVTHWLWRDGEKKKTELISNLVVPALWKKKVSWYLFVQPINSKSNKVKRSRACESRHHGTAFLPWFVRKPKTRAPNGFGIITTWYTYSTHYVSAFVCNNRRAIFPDFIRRLGSDVSYGHPFPDKNTLLKKCSLVSLCFGNNYRLYCHAPHAHYFHRAPNIVGLVDSIFFLFFIY